MSSRIPVLASARVGADRTARWPRMSMRRCTVAMVAIVAMLAAFLRVTPAPAAPGDPDLVWTTVPGLSASGTTDWFSITGKPGQYVALSVYGEVGVATDPSGSWSNGYAGPGAGVWQGFTYGNGQYVAMSTTGSVAFTADPTGAWTNATGIVSGETWQNLQYLNGVFVSVSNTGLVAVAADPAGTWTIEAHIYGGLDWFAMTYGNGQYVALDDISGVVATAPTLAGPWIVSAGPATGSFVRVAAVASRFVALGVYGSVKSAADPTGAWEDTTGLTGAIWFGMANVNGRLIALSTDGTIALGGFEPTLAAAAPATGSVAGGTQVTLSGTGLHSATSVTIGGVPVSVFSVLDDSTIIAATPPGPSGPATVVVTTPFGTATLPDAFLYAEPPTTTTTFSSTTLAPATTTTAAATTSTTSPPALIIDLRSSAGATTPDVPGAALPSPSPSAGTSTTSPDTTSPDTTTTTTGSPTTSTTSTTVAPSSVPARLPLAPIAATLHGSVFIDANRNGVKETGERDLAGLVARLYRGRTLIATSSTPYRFDAQPAGTYTIRFSRTRTGRTIATRTVTVTPDGTVLG